MKKKKKSSKEKSVEVFEVEKKGKKKEIQKKSEVENERATKDELVKQQNQLRNILWVLGIVILIIIFILAGLKIIRISHYENVKFEIVQEGDLIFYNTKIPLYDSSYNHVADYNFYLRTPPRELEKVPFEGDLSLLKGYVLNVTENFDCDGDGVISLANLARQYQVAGMVYINDTNAGCDSENRYLYFELKEGDETKIVQRGESSCYDVYINNCEILPATEKLMAEGFVILSDMKIIISA